MPPVKNFENERWSQKSQSLEFRHQAALKLINTGPVLDLGCGDGLFLNLLKKKEITGQGLDISETAIKKCQNQGLTAQIFDFTNQPLPFADNSFPCIIMLDVLEHLYNPEFLLNEAQRVTQKYIIFSVPNFNSLPARLQVLFGQVPQNNKPQKGHIYWFNYKNLKALLAQNNLRIIAIKTHTFWENKSILNTFTKILLKIWPALFALSFVVKVKKNEI